MQAPALYVHAVAVDADKHSHDCYSSNMSAIIHGLELLTNPHLNPSKNELFILICECG